MGTKLISVIMPVYNAEKYLKESIQSILNQTFTDFELIICEDGSTDNSLKIIQSFCDERTLLITNEKNLGIPLTINKLINNCQGEYIARLDSDDISLPKRLEKQAYFLDKNPEVGLCGTNFITFGGKEKRMFMPQSDSEIRAYMLVNNPICQPTIMIRRSSLTQYYDPTYDVAEDYAHCYELSKSWKLANLPDFLLKYRCHGDNISLTKKQKMIENANQIRSKIFRETLQYNINKNETKLLRLATDSRIPNLNDLHRFEEFLLDIQIRNKMTKYYQEKSLNQLTFHLWASACLKSSGINHSQKINTLMHSELFSFSYLVQDISYRHLETAFKNLITRS